MPEFIDTAEVARRLEMRPALFLKKRAWMETALGFPPPIPLCHRPLKWRAADVTAWKANLGRETPLVVPFFRSAVPPGQSLALLREARTV
ncbi:hypothetical protein [Pararhodobacter sp.]|uniref:hypothetical protein n=1 Tax=Pararhodobacter sp. TaxID=2127056 RepID=UPI002FDE133A